MVNPQNITMTQALNEHWGFAPNGECYGGCGTEVGIGHWHHREGHDLRFTHRLLVRLLVELAGDPRVAQAIQDVVQLECAPRE